MSLLKFVSEGEELMRESDRLDVSEADIERTDVNARRALEKRMHDSANLTAAMKRHIARGKALLAERDAASKLRDRTVCGAPVSGRI